MPSVIGLWRSVHGKPLGRWRCCGRRRTGSLPSCGTRNGVVERFVISRETVVEVLAGPDHDDVTAGADGPATENPMPMPMPVPRSVVPVWCEGHEASVLSAD